MDPVTTALAVFILMLAVLATGMWVFLALATAAAVSLFAFMGFPPDKIGAIASRIIVRSASSWELAAVPMFIWMGEIMFRTDISERLYKGLSPLVSKIPGGLLHTNVLGSALFAAVSGSSAATTATVGRITTSELNQRGYSQSLALGSLAGAGSLGLLIPPSIVLIIYGVLAEVSIAKLFIAGVVPGLMIAAFYAAYLAARCAITPALAPKDIISKEDARPSAILGNLAPVFGLILVVIGSIYTGWATPSEAAAIGVFAALCFAAFSRQLSRAMLAESLINALKTSCMVCSILMCAAFLSSAIGYMHIPRNIAVAIDALDLSPYVLIASLAIFYILLGFFLDGISIIVMSLPITLPVVVAAGFDPIWYGIFLVIMIELGQMTPPVGFNLFVIQGFSGVPIHKVAVYAIPFFLLMCFAVLLMVVFPQIALWLPAYLAG
ncbi:TRAP transporter large permease [Phaeobacter inhibens]|uniref:TRAP transporter large permease n=1 Tax=Phaeobacter inhibens TaxID=221822 RepID=UPI000C9B08B3|nr:TRAP transporter large permease subunit [Phaeobacter inhibens]AUQ68951.1 TRAP dicarboxylate transporter, DctM subunit [Phaeobacter inhibens]UWR45224.1 TRAP transporter large permease subunit [Phaeobacter inhibens]UWR53060.1 TRAP transporter large permease subunit [Phaeobacter inhibens]UWR57790.1 TRAP transporter large permease subunit [Phaeobacter inhibens]UWR84519.1 TRAP transporter large permease subunit [Phaeobacter inhibens]